jgi:hypothetical protein
VCSISATPVVELYDVRRDPDETDDLAGGRAADVTRLDRRLAGLLPHLDAPGATPRSEVVDRLRALGYLR